MEIVTRLQPGSEWLQNADDAPASQMLLFVTEGRMTIYHGGKKTTVGRHQVVVSNKGGKPSVEGNNYSFTIIRFNVKFFRKHLRPYLQVSKGDTGDHDEQILSLSRDRAYLVVYLESLITNCMADMRVLVHSLRIIPLLQLFVLECTFTSGPELKLPFSFHARPLYERFRNLILSAPSPPLKVKEYAHQLGVSPNHLNKMIKQVCGHGAKYVLTELLIELAVAHLQKPGITVQMASAAIGFKDPAHFIRVFKKMKLQTPGSFIKTVR